MFETLEKLVNLDSCSDSNGGFLLLNGVSLLIGPLASFIFTLFITALIWRIAISDFIFYYRNGWNFNEDSKYPLYGEDNTDIKLDNYWKIILSPLFSIVTLFAFITAMDEFFRRILEICSDAVG